MTLPDGFISSRLAGVLKKIMRFDTVWAKNGHWRSVNFSGRLLLIKATIFSC